MFNRLRMLMVIGVLLIVILISPVFAQSRPQGELVIALPNDPTSLYGPNVADTTAANAAAPLYDTLITVDDAGEFIPQLAESWDISDDGTVYTFTLRQDVTFHNGEPFNADSVIATWEFGQTEGNQSTDDYARASSVEALDDFTVQLTTPEPDALFLRILADDWWLIPPQYMAEVGIEGFELAPVGTGPFVFVERDFGDSITYDANRNYWQAEQPKVERVIFQTIPNSTNRLAAIQSGDVDIATRLTRDEASLLEVSGDVNLISYTADRVYYVGFKDQAPLDDVRVRQALNYGVNKQALIDTIFDGSAQVIAGFTISSNLGYDDSIVPFTYDPEQARILLTDAGFADGFEISMGCPTDAYNNINQVCLAIQRDLAEIGVDVAVEFRTTNSFWAEPSYGTVGEMYVDSWSSSTGEALPRLEGALTPGNYYNTWDDPELVSIIDDLARTLDREARSTLYTETQQYMVDNPPFIYLYTLDQFEATSTRVEGYSPRPNERYDLNTVSLSN